jgi:chaperonin GroES
LSRRRRQRAGSSFPTPPKKNPWKATSSRSDPAPAAKTGKVHPLDVKAGDRVLFAKWSGTEVKINGEELMIMKESDVMGIIDSGAAAGNKS